MGGTSPTTRKKHEKVKQPQNGGQRGGEEQKKTAKSGTEMTSTRTDSKTSPAQGNGTKNGRGLHADKMDYFFKLTVGRRTNQPYGTNGDEKNHAGVREPTRCSRGGQNGTINFQAVPKEGQGKLKQNLKNLDDALP